MLKKFFALVLAASALMVVPQLGRAQATLSLSQAVDAAWARAVQAAETAGDARRAEAALVAAQAPWAAAPALEVGQRRDHGPEGRTRETEVALVLPLWLPGQRAAGAAAATAQAQAAEAALLSARLRLAGQVREAQWNVRAQETDHLAAQAQLRTIAELARDVDRRVAAGDLARTDALVASAEEITARATVVAAKQKTAAALAQWRALTGLNDVPPGDSEQVPASANVPEAHPHLRAARAAVQWAQGRLEAARLARRDAPELAIGSRHETAPLGGGDTRGVGVSLRIPFATASRNQPLLAAALADLDIAEAKERKTRLDLAAELEIALGALDAARAGLMDDERRAALLRERHSLLERSFRAGNTALADLLRALSSASQAEADVQRRGIALRLAQARVQQAMGLIP